MRRHVLSALAAAAFVGSWAFWPTPVIAQGRGTGSSRHAGATRADTIRLAIHRLTPGTGSAWVTNGIPLPPGFLVQGELRRVHVSVAGQEVPVRVSDLAGRFADGSIRSVLIAFRASVPDSAVDAVLVVGTPRHGADPKPQPDRVAEAVALPVDPEYLAGTELVRDVLPVSKTPPYPSVFQQYEKRFVTYAERHWQKDGSRWVEANYYDRAKIYYVWWMRTGNVEYWRRATALALDYRTKYLEAGKYSPSPFWAQMGGIMLHYLLTGDEKSRTAVGRVADGFAMPNYMRNMGSLSSDWMDNRGQARALTAFLYAYLLDAPRHPYGNDARLGRDWPQLLHVALDTILETQSPDGAYRFQSPTTQCGYNKPFMVGILNDALQDYYELFQPDRRIPGVVKKSLDYMWEKDWDSGKQAFAYLDGPCPGHDGAPARDLNNLLASGFGWTYKMTGDTTYLARGDQVFAGGVQGSWLDGTKQFNQEYTISYRYLALREWRPTQKGPRIDAR